MTPRESQELIDAAGGNFKFAALIGINSSPGHKQRVSNWRRRGIPSAVVLAHKPVFDSLQHAMTAGGRRAEG